MTRASGIWSMGGVSMRMMSYCFFEVVEQVGHVGIDEEVGGGGGAGAAGEDREIGDGAFLDGAVESGIAVEGDLFSQEGAETVSVIDGEDFVLARAAHIGINEEHAAADFGDGDGQVAGDGGFAFGGAGAGENNGLELGVEGVFGREEDGNESGAKAFGDGGRLALEGFEFDAGL